jgi:hypothetical protein
MIIILKRTEYEGLKCVSCTVSKLIWLVKVEWVEIAVFLLCCYYVSTS